MVIVAVDSGTTSTRAWVLDGGTILSASSARGGARDVARGDGFDLLSHVRTVATGALHRADRAWEEVEAVVAFGMITSELGLEEIEHVEAPADAGDLVGSLKEWTGPDRLPAPLYLVPGVRRTAAETGDADVMRGEETEVVGLLSSGHVDPPVLYVSTGSHTKFVVVDARGQIAWSMTTLSGELVWALHRETILSELVDPSGRIRDLEALQAGADLAEREGLSRALFAARLLNRLEGAGPQTCSDFIHGAVAGADLRSLWTLLGRRGEGPTRVVIGGGTPLAAAYRNLLDRDHRVADVESTDRPLGALGAWALFAELATERQRERR
jgi:2-dehydro-3-deoxygalactonokinase